MDSQDAVELHIQWHCPQCGQHHERWLTMPSIDPTGAHPKVVAAGPLQCSECGHCGPIKAQATNASQLSFQPISGALFQVSNRMENQIGLKAWVRSLKKPSDN